MNQDKIIEKRMKEKQQRIDKAIANKEKSIAYFNSVNASIELLKDYISLNQGEEKAKELLRKWRNWFYQEWQNWYLENMPTEWEKELEKLPSGYQKAQIAEDEKDTYIKEQEPLEE